MLQNGGVVVLDPVAIEHDVEGTDPAGRPAGYDEPWSLGSTTLSGDWSLNASEEGATYVWPDKTLAEFDSFDVYQGRTASPG